MFYPRKDKVQLVEDHLTSAIIQYAHGAPAAPILLCTHSAVDIMTDLLKYLLKNGYADPKTISTLLSYDFPKRRDVFSRNKDDFSFATSTNALKHADKDANLPVEVAEPSFYIEYALDLYSGFCSFLERSKLLVRNAGAVQYRDEFTEKRQDAMLKILTDFRMQIKDIFKQHGKAIKFEDLPTLSPSLSKSEMLISAFGSWFSLIDKKLNDFFEYYGYQRLDILQFLVNSPQFWSQEFDERLQTAVDKAIRDAEVSLAEFMKHKADINVSEEFSIIRAYIVEQTRPLILDFMREKNLGYQGPHENTYKFALLEEDPGQVGHLVFRYDPECK